MKYKVEVIEEHKKTIEILASSESDAKHIAYIMNDIGINPLDIQEESIETRFEVVDARTK